MTSTAKRRAAISTSDPSRLTSPGSDERRRRCDRCTSRAASARVNLFFLVALERPRASRSVPHSLRLSLSIRSRVPRHRHAPPLDPAPPASTPSFSAPALRPRLSKSSSASTSSGDSEESASASIVCPGSRDDGPAPSPAPGPPPRPRKDGGGPPAGGGAGRLLPPRGYPPTAPLEPPRTGAWRAAERAYGSTSARVACTLISPSLNTDTLSRARRSTLYA